MIKCVICNEAIDMNTYFFNVKDKYICNDCVNKIFIDVLYVKVLE